MVISFYHLVSVTGTPTSLLKSKSLLSGIFEVLKCFGVNVERPNDREFIIKGNQKFKPTKLYCEGDWSNSAFLEAFNLIGGNVKVSGLNINSTQGDKIYREYFENLKQGTPVLDITDCPDLAPILMRADTGGRRRPWPVR